MQPQRSSVILLDEEPALLRICHRVRKEALQILYGTDGFQTTSLNLLMRWMRSLTLEERSGIQKMIISTEHLRNCARQNSVLGSICAAGSRITAIEDGLAGVDCALPIGAVHIPVYNGRGYVWMNVYGSVAL